MSQRTFHLSGSVVDFSGSPIVGAPCSFQPLFPGGLLGAVDGNGAVVESAPVTFTTDAGGNLVLLDGTSPVLIDYPGDYQVAYQATQVQVTLNGQAYISPVGFGYASSIDISAWISAAVATGLVTMRFVYTADDNTPIVGALISLTLLAPALVVATGQQLSGSVPSQAKTDSSGTAYLSLNPNSLLNPNNLGYAISAATPDGSTEILPWISVVPAVVDVYKGAYNAGTTYHGASGSSSGDVVLSAAVLYRFINVTPSAGHAPPNATYWAVVAGLPTDLLSAHATFSAQVGQMALDASTIGAAENNPGSLHGSPASVQDVLDNQEYKIAHPALFGASGGSHAPGDVPDPGGSAGTAKYLREDATWEVPPGAGGGSGSGTITNPRARYWPQAVSAYPPTIGAGTTVTADGRFNSFPGLGVSPLGTLFAVYGDVTSEPSLDGIVTLQTSVDGGATWSGKRALFTSVGSTHNYYQADILFTATGRALLSFLDQPGGSGSPSYVMQSISDDYGVTWSAPVQLSPYTASITACADRPLQHSTGAIIRPVYGEDSGDTAVRPGVLISNDYGSTYGSRINIGGASTALSEMSLIELPNGHIKAFIRHEGAATNSLYTSVSTDVGLTWSAPALLAAFNVYPGKPCAVLIPVSQILVLFYRGVTGAHAVYRTSPDYGATWDSEQLYSGAVYEYAAGCALNDNTIGFVVSAGNGSTFSNITFNTFSAGAGGGGGGGTYTLPVASGSTLGGVKVGQDLAIDLSGVLGVTVVHQPIVLSVTAGVPDFLTAGNDIVMA